jgi:hypothetical protein
MRTPFNYVIRREALDRKSNVLQNNLRLAGKGACESLAVDDDRWMNRKPQNGGLYQMFDAISIHRIALTVPKAAVLSREWILGFQKKKLIWGAHVVISKEFRMLLPSYS